MLAALLSRGQAFFDHGHITIHHLVNFCGLAIGIVSQGVKRVTARLQHVFHLKVELVDRLVNQR